MLVKYSKEIARSPFEIIRNIYRYRHIFVGMVVREIKGRFAGSVGGLFWHFIHPLLMLVTYLFVFVYIFKLRVGTGGSGASAMYLMAGLFPWIILAEGVMRGTHSMLENATIIQKTFFPTEILTAKTVIAPFFSYGAAIVILALYRLIAHGSFSIVLFLPLLLVLQFFLTLGVSFLSATFSVFFRDVTQLVQVLVSFWIYATPILYPIGMLPEWARSAMYFNPVYPFMSSYQSLFVSGSIGQPSMLLLAFLWSAFFFVTGSFVFNKLKFEFADWL